MGHETVTYTLPQKAEFYTGRSRRGDKPLRAAESQGIPVIPSSSNGEQVSGGPIGTRDRLAWKTTRRGMVWKFGKGHFPLPQGEIIYSNDVVASESQLKQPSLWENTA